MGIKNLPNTINIGEAVSKKYVDNNFNYPRKYKNTAKVDFEDKNLDKVTFLKVNSRPAVGEHLATKYYVDQGFSDSVDESTVVRTNKENDFKKFKLTNESKITLKAQAINHNQVFAKSYVDQFRQEK